MQLLSEIRGIRTPVFQSSHFQEFTVNFDEARISAQEVNRRLIEKGIQGGKDISKEYPELGQTSLYCVTEIHSRLEIERLRDVLEQSLGQR
jgi:glycine dehydrogenase subunit 1